MSVAIRVDLLTGRFVAAQHDDRTAPEWPPHPARLFSALVDAWGAAEITDDTERHLLEKIERWEPPAIAAWPPTLSQILRRVDVTNYVPVNDPKIVRSTVSIPNEKMLDAIEVIRSATSNDKQKARAAKTIAKRREVDKHVAADPSLSLGNLDLLPSNRKRQERFFPSVKPDVPRVVFYWEAADVDANDRAILEGLLARVTRIGHASTLVSCRLDDTAVEPTLVPDDDGNTLLRVVGKGQTRELIRRFDQHHGFGPRSMPSLPQPYAVVMGNDDEVFRPDYRWEWVPLVFSTGSSTHRSSRNLPVQRSVEVAKAVRGAVLKYTGDPIPTVISGHDPNGSQTADQHIAIVPIPNAGHPYADGRLLGVAILLPAGDRTARRQVLSAVWKWQEDNASEDRPEGVVQLHGRRIGKTWLHYQEDLTTAPSGIRPDGWERPARVWYSVTPVALHRHPGDLQTEESFTKAEATIRDACSFVGLPDPIEVGISLDPLVRGSVPAARYPAYYQGKKRRLARRLVHVGLRFEQPVMGPIVLGSGRFDGLGLLRPITSGGAW